MSGACVRLWICACAALGLAGCADKREPVEVLFVGGPIYTAVAGAPIEENASASHAGALAMSNGQIVAVGERTTLEARFEPAKLVDLAGKFLMPGFIDSHAHPIQGGLQLGQCDLSNDNTIAELKDAISACASDTPGEGWLVGAGWNLSLFPQANPQAAFLDEIAPDRPVFLRGADGHSAWGNTKALAMAGLTAETPAPVNGVIEHDPATGRPSGVVRESAIALLEAAVPATTEAERETALVRALDVLAEHGITTVVDAAANEHEWNLYRRFNDEGRLTARVNVSLAAQSSTEVPASLDVESRDPYLRADAAKIFVDGVLEGETAALLAPYASGKSGTLSLSADELNRLVTLLDAKHAQVHMHAIGDAAVRAALDAVAAAEKTNGPRERRHHIAHLQLIHPDDYPRFAELGVTANFQALWAFPDGYIVDVNLPAVGQERVDRMYPIGSLARAGARLVGGSDWPVSSVGPLYAIEVAVTRQDPDGVRSGVLNEAERIDLATALAAYTVNGAWLTGRAAEVGTLEAGKRADLVVLDRNPFTVPPDELSEVRVVQTYVDGKQIWPK